MSTLHAQDVFGSFRVPTNPFFGTPHRLAAMPEGWPSGPTSHKLWPVMFFFLCLLLTPWSCWCGGKNPEFWAQNIHKPSTSPVKGSRLIHSEVIGSGLPCETMPFCWANIGLTQRDGQDALLRQPSKRCAFLVSGTQGSLRPFRDETLVHVQKRYISATFSSGDMFFSWKARPYGQDALKTYILHDVSSKLIIRQTSSIFIDFCSKTPSSAVFCGSFSSTAFCGTAGHRPGQPRGCWRTSNGSGSASRWRRTAKRPSKRTRWWKSLVAWRKIWWSENHMEVS